MYAPFLSNHFKLIQRIYDFENKKIDNNLRNNEQGKIHKHMKSSYFAGMLNFQSH